MRGSKHKPASLDECMSALQEVLTTEEQAEVIGMTKDELIQCHHGLGRWIRNNWDLWKGGALFDYMKKLGFIHPDDMSMSIIREYWARMNKIPSTIETEIKEYKDYWNKQGKNE